MFAYYCVQASSPTDSVLDMKKKKRLNQMAAKEREAQKDQQQHSEAAGGLIGISDCDLGASPQMSKNSIIPKKYLGKWSPLAQTRELSGIKKQQ